MKNIFLVSYIVVLLISQSVAAQTPSETASSSPTVVIDKDIQQLKEKIANKVSEIRKQNNKAISGFVVSIDGNKMQIKNDEEENQVKFDDTLTKYFKINGVQKKEIKSEDVKKNDYAIISGVVADSVITANVVLIDENFLIDSGRVIEINKDSFNIEVLTNDKNTYSLDFESDTKQSMLNIKSLELEKAGFGKIKEGDTLHFVVKKTGNPLRQLADGGNNNYSAIKVLIIPQEYFIK